MQQYYRSSPRERSRLTTIDNCGLRPLSYEHAVRSPASPLHHRDDSTDDDDEDEYYYDHCHYQCHYPFQQSLHHHYEHDDFEEELEQDSQQSDQHCITDHDETSTFVSELTTPTVVSSSRFFQPRRPAVEPEPSMSASELEKAIRKMERKLREMSEKAKVVEKHEKNQVISGGFLCGDGKGSGESMAEQLEDEESSKPILDWEARVCDQNEKCKQQKGESSAECQSKSSKDDIRRTVDRSLSSSTFLRSCDKINHDGSFYGCFPLLERSKETRFPPRPKRLLRALPSRFSKEEISGGCDSSEGEDKYRKVTIPGIVEGGEDNISSCDAVKLSVPLVLKCASSSSHSSESDASIPEKDQKVTKEATSPLSSGSAIHPKEFSAGTQTDIAMSHHHHVVKETIGGSPKERIAKARLAKRIIEKRFGERAKASGITRTMMVVDHDIASAVPCNRDGANPPKEGNITISDTDHNISVRKSETSLSKTSSNLTTLSKEQRQEEMQRRKQRLAYIRDRLADSRMSKDDIATEPMSEKTYIKNSLQ